KKDTEIIRSEGTHEVTFVEGTNSASGRKATPQSKDTRKMGGDRFEGGPEGKGAQDRYASGAAGDKVEDRYEGRGWDSIQDRWEGAGGGEAIEDRYAGGGSADHIQDRLEGGASEGVQDRMAGGAGPDGIQDRMEGGGKPARGPGDRFVPLDQALVARDRLILQPIPEAPKRTHRLYEVLAKVPKPVFQPVEMFKDVEQLNTRLTDIRGRTDQIRKGMALEVGAAADASPTRKDSKWPMKKKLPKL
ncbi:MAG: hypothetical protein ACO3X3_06470, partial [Burkholderiaceae bacterium]